MSRLDELFEAALAIAPEQRDAWLDAVCDNDAALRNELKRLLAADARPEGILESGLGLVCEALAEETDTPEHLGDWRVLGPLGTGGMGAVWLAERDGGDFVQRAAIKQVAWPTPGLLQRFRTERQILARLEHPGIARLIDGGVDDTGCPYLAMEYVEGTRIDTWVREHELDVRATVRLLLQVCEAMQFAHRNLIVHSDIKPSNILVGEDGKPRLLDFGIARVLSEEGTDGTHTATRMLTPDYAAPEWLAGGPVTTAVDIYALGVLAYELLSGSKPYRIARDGTHPATQTPDAPTRPPSAVLDVDAIHRRARQRALRGDLDRVVLTAMAREPERRYATVEAFAADLRNWLDGRVVAARGDHTWYRVRRFVVRHRVGVAASTLAILALVAATVFSLHQADVARRQAQRADAVRDFLIGVFDQTSPDQNQDHPVTARQLLEAGERELDAGVLESNASHAGMAGLVGHLYWQIGDYDKALALLERAVAHRDPLVPEDVRARDLLYLGQAEFNKQLLEDAKFHVQQALAAARRAGSSADDVASGARRLYALVLAQGGEPKLAEPILTEALKADRARFGSHSSAVAADLLQLAWINRELGELEKAIGYAQQGNEVATALHGRASRQVIQGLQTLASAQAHSGNLRAAEKALREAAGLAAKVYGAANHETIVARTGLYMILHWQHRNEEALAGYRSLLPQVEAVVASEPERLAQTWNYICIELYELGRFNEAVDAARRSLGVWAKLNRPDPNGNDIDSEVNLAKSLTMSGRLDEAEKAWRQALRAETSRAPSSSKVNWYRGELGNVLRLQHKFPQAVNEIQSALDTPPPAGKPGFRRAHLQSLLALAQLESGDVAAADRTAAQAERAATAMFGADSLNASESAFVAARVKLARDEAAEAEVLLRSVLQARVAHYKSSSDPRVLEIEVALVRALEMQGKKAEAAPLRAEVEPLLAKSASPYLADLRQRLDSG